MSQADPTKMLSGFRVLDLTNVLAGPFCCHQLAHMGAQVIKVEVPGSGDLARQLGADPELNEGLMGVSFLAQNTGKQSITINFKHPEGKAVLRRLVRTADVLVENFRPGVMDRLELGFTALREENPELVYCAVSGFGQDGPLCHLPAYDQIIQGMSGIMSITGDAESSPLRVGYPISDTVGGMTAAFAITGALTGGKAGRRRGCFIDISMLEATLATMGWVVSNWLIADQAPQPMGNDNFTASPSGTFRTGDGLLNIAANKQEQFETTCRILERADLIEDPRFRQRQTRLLHRAALKTELEKALVSKSAKQWQDLLSRAGVPAGRVLSVPQAVAQTQVSTRGLIGEFEDAPGVGRPIRVARTGVKIDGQALSTSEPPPALGQHTDDVLRSLGYNAQSIRSLRDCGAV